MNGTPYQRLRWKPHQLWPEPNRCDSKDNLWAFGLGVEWRGFRGNTKRLYFVCSDFTDSQFDWKSLVIIRVSEYWVGISDDNPSFRIYKTEKPHVLLRLTNVVSPFLYTRGLVPWWGRFGKIFNMPAPPPLILPLFLDFPDFPEWPLKFCVSQYSGRVPVPNKSDNSTPP